MSIKWLVRAVNINGNRHDLNVIPMDSFLTFALIFKCAQENEGLPPLSWIPRTWVDEIYPQFMNPTGIITAFEMVVSNDGIETIKNAIWFTTGSEGRKLHIHDLDIINAAGILLEHERIHEQVFKQNEMSGDFHMGFYTNGEHVEIAKDRIPEIDRKFGWGETLKKHVENPLSINIQKIRAPGDNSGIFKFEPFEPDEGIAMTFEESQELDKEDITSIQVGSSDRHNHDNWYDAPALDLTQYRIYINGTSSKMILNNIEFMKVVHYNVLDGRFKVHDIPGCMEIQQSLFDLIDNFLRNRDFKIGAHPIDQMLEDGHDVNYSLFWGPGEKETCYVHPGKSYEEDPVDDVNF